MKVAGIVAEYNPFHNGHAYHVERTREMDPHQPVTHVVAVMSGHFVQRGEPALATKFARAAAALACGVDLVLELPVPWVLSSAEGFAFGAVAILNALGCVDVLSFGSESGDVAALQKAVDIMTTPAFIQRMKYYMEQGISFAEAQQKAMAQIAGDNMAALLSSPNNVLGIEYIKALRKLNSSIQPVTVHRTGAQHDAAYPIGNTASASYIRTLAREGHWSNAGPFMPPAVFARISEEMAQGRAAIDPTVMDRAILAKLRSMSAEDFKGLAGISEGLENRVAEASKTAKSVAEWETKVKTKRYPLTRIRRMMWSAVLGIPADMVYTSVGNPAPPPYIRVLATNARGEEILAAAKKAGATLPVVSKAAHIRALDDRANMVWQLECRASDWYGLAVPSPIPAGMEYTAGIIRV